MFQKEFAERDISRIRNLVTKKFGDRTSVQTGYDTPDIERQEGDVWEENGRKFRKKHGKIQPILATEALRELTRVPLNCPVCGGSILCEADKKFMLLRKACVNCVTKAETDLKISGKYEEYAEQHVKQNLQDWIKEMESDLAELTGIQSNEMSMTEAGDAEVWNGGDTLSTESITQSIEKLKKGSL